jgi:lysophospholipid acyltransferase (LPLAT)-like uncharacterized protein
MRQFWRETTNRLARRPWMQGLLAGVVWRALNFVHRTNPLRAETADVIEAISKEEPLIFALWHGQHIMVPFTSPKGLKVATMLSRSPDAAKRRSAPEKAERRRSFCSKGRWGAVSRW